jgi:glutamyl-tRNA synthetase
MSQAAPGTVRTRFAPSPTGHLHVGGARTALFCWAYAKGRNGKFVLRIEDTDQKRSSEAATSAMIEDLKWLGIDWDEGPFHQSQRLELYRQHAEVLVERGRAALDGGAVRFRVPREGTVSFHDEVRGDVSVSATELEDFVIVKADGYPTYHFAVVVDDELMGVTHVIRAQEHLSNTPRHVLLQEALGFRRPVYAHISLIFNPDGSKMSKRDKDRILRRAVEKSGLHAAPDLPGTGAPAIPADRWGWWRSSPDRQLDLDDAERLAEALGVRLPEIDVEDFRRAGYLPEVMVNYLALLGWSPGEGVEKFSREFLVERFDLDRVIRSPARFDRDKLLAFNLDALQAMPPEAFRARLAAHGARYHPDFVGRLGEDFDLFARANQGRSKTLDDPYRSCRFLLVPDVEIVYERTKGVQKALAGAARPTGYERLEAVLPVLESVREWTVGGLEEAVTGYAQQHAGGQLGGIAQPLRIAVTGGTVSPAIFETLALLGRDASLARIRRCLGVRPV